MLYRRELPVNINHARRFASHCITARQHFALWFSGRSVFITGPEGSEAEIEKLVSETSNEAT